MIEKIKIRNKRVKFKRFKKLKIFNFFIKINCVGKMKKTLKN